MSFFDDYVADGLCCQTCGELLDGSEPGYARYCAGCDPANKHKPNIKHHKRRRPRK